MNGIWNQISSLRSAGRLTAHAFLAGSLVAAVISPVTALGQSLDDAINAQLEVVNGIECGRLLNGVPGNTSFLVEGLGLYQICTRGIPTPGIGPSLASGGGAATPVTLPSIMQKRLREARIGERKLETTGASADSVAEYESGISLFLSGEFESLERDTTEFEAGYESDIWRLTSGVDYQFTEQIVAGLAVDYYRHDGDFEGGGGFDTDSYGLLTYGTFVPIEQAYLQVVAGYARKDYHRDRIASFVELNLADEDDEDDEVSFNIDTSGRAKADYNGEEYQLGALVGFDYALNRVTVSPRVGVDWRRIELEGYEENGISGLELRFDDDHATSLQSRIGAQASVTVETGYDPVPLVIPQASFDWLHEFENDQRDIGVSFVEDTRRQEFTYETEKPDRDWFEVNAGIVVALPFGLQGFGNYRTLFDQSDFDSHTGTFGFRKTF